VASILRAQRRGVKRTIAAPLDAIIPALAAEATPPDLL
jgi:hypothetical protein